MRLTEAPNGDALVDVDPGERYVRVHEPGRDVVVRVGGHPVARGRGDDFLLHLGPVVPSPPADAAVTPPPDPVPPLPAWAPEIVGYHVVVDRFAAPRGARLSEPDRIGWLGTAGGTVRGLRARLPYLAALGVNTLLVSPLHAGGMNMNYDVVDHVAVDPRLGSEADVRALVAGAHARGIRVLLDIELSYLGFGHPAVRAAYADPGSAERGWLRWDPERDTAHGWQNSPAFAALDHGRPQVRALLTEAVRFWAGLGVDGFRLDAAHDAPVDFWREIRAALDPEVLLIGELIRPWQQCRDYRGALSGAFDFELTNAMRHVVGAGAAGPSALEEVLARRDPAARDFLPVTVLDNHDLDRFLHVSAGSLDRLVLALTVLTAAPGVPVLYYGTEAGLCGAGAADADRDWREPMRWGRRHPRLHAATTALLHARRDCRALTVGTRLPLECHDRTGLLAFERRADADAAVVVANLSPDRAQALLVPVVGSAHRVIGPAAGGAEVERRRGAARVSVPPLSAVLLLSGTTPRHPKAP